MATTSLDSTTRIPDPAPIAARDIEKRAELQVVAGQALGRASLVGLTREELKAKLAAIGVPERELRMRVGQLWHWIYLRGVEAFDEMSNVGKGLRQALTDAYSLDRPEVVSEQVSKDGTFCHTGTQRLVRNLTSAEIAAQLVVARDALGDWPGRTPPAGAFLPSDVSRSVSNIVFMGMGEPLYNPDNVIPAVAVLSDNEGLGLSRRRITVSTSGVVPQMERLGREANAMLAISLHAVRDELRDVLVPLNRKYPIRDLLAACRDYPGVSNARRITFEYVMLKGVNDSDADARELVRLLKGIPAKINLIPFNPWPGATYECSDWGRIERFSEIVFRAGYASPVRTPRGRDILAACGQLKSETEKLRARARLMLESGIGAEGVYALGDDA
jgi:23S rRNA (adenine2503-C2)-methyltransferase